MYAENVSRNVMFEHTAAVSEFTRVTTSNAGPTAEINLFTHGVTLHTISAVQWCAEKNLLLGHLFSTSLSIPGHAEPWLLATTVPQERLTSTPLFKSKCIYTGKQSSKWKAGWEKIPQKMSAWMHIRMLLMTFLYSLINSQQAIRIFWLKAAPVF